MGIKHPRYHTYKNQTKTTREWADELEIPIGCFRRRVQVFINKDKIFHKGYLPPTNLSNLDPQKALRIRRLGIAKVRELGLASYFTTETATEAGRKGGKAVQKLYKRRKNAKLKRTRRDGKEVR